MPIPNSFPTITSPNKLAIIGEFPTKDDYAYQRIFSDKCGRFLSNLLSSAGISRDQCYFGNVCQEYPPEGHIQNFAWDGPEIQSGLAQLQTDLHQYKPNMVVCLGNLALKAARDPQTVHLLLPKNFQWKVSVQRGTMFQAYTGPFATYKCISTYTPEYAFRDYSVTPLLRFDLRRAVEESLSPELVLPQRMIRTDLSFESIVEALANIRQAKTPIAIDIEGCVNTLSCISIATSPLTIFIIPFVHKDGTSYWPQDKELYLWKCLGAMLEDPEVPKILQNANYDTFVLQYSYGICVRNVQHDIMLKHWELNAEMDKNLGLQTSIYTREPYYKGDIKSQDEETFYRYCCKDSAVTLEISDYLDYRIKDSSLAHYERNMELLLPFRYMQMRGVKYDYQKARERCDDLQAQMFAAQARLNALTGFGFDWTSKQKITDHVSGLMSLSKAPIVDLTVTCPVKKEFAEAFARLQMLWQKCDPDLTTMGEIESLCEVGLNVGSNKQLCNFLYNDLQLPPQYNEDEIKPSLTANYEAMLHLSAYCKKTDQPQVFDIIQTIMEIRDLGTRARLLKMTTDSDGRIRTSFNIVGTKTGRVTSYISVTGSGCNTQTIPKYKHAEEAPGGVTGDRDLLVADEGKWFFECDLEGADSWTVAAYCAMLGDNTMLDDLQCGIRPAKRTALILRGVQIDYDDRKAVLEACKQVSKDDIDYFICKRVVHGASYMEGPITIGRNVLKDSGGKVVLEQRECKRLRDAVLCAYPGIPRWQAWVSRQVSQRPCLTMASGQKHIFLGRPNEILTSAVAAEPQTNTTFILNTAIWKLWNDPENRDPQGNLYIEPLLQVHDALEGQFPKERTEWAIKKIRSYYNNPIKIAGRQILIPFEGGYGPDWLHLDTGKI